MIIGSGGILCLGRVNRILKFLLTCYLSYALCYVILEVFELSTCMHRLLGSLLDLFIFAVSNGLITQHMCVHFYFSYYHQPGNFATLLRVISNEIVHRARAVIGDDVMNEPLQVRKNIMT